MPPLRCTLRWLGLLLLLSPASGDWSTEPSAGSTEAQTKAPKGRWRERLRGAVFATQTLQVQRHSAVFQRVTQPKNGFKTPKDCTFRVESAAAALDITPSTGVVYVDDPTALHTYPDDTDELKIKIVCGNETFEHNLHVQLDSRETQCGNETGVWCADFSGRDKCRRGCGAGSSAFCSWRAAPASADKMDPTYATCSPDLAFCPNSECDELEQIDMHICPQDCTEHVFGSGMLSDKERGIGTASGVCSCSTHGRCTCSNEKSTTDSYTSPKLPKVTPSSTPEPHPGCDSTCMVLIGCVALLLVILLATALYTKSLVQFARIILSRREALLEPKESSLCQWSLEHHHQTSSGGEQETCFSYPPNSKQSLLDSKWEFPRERLCIEKVLGEGEFGQVLQAAAIDLPGVAGRTTVAVKALKDGAGSAELNDLITEYEHLKEVSHPNIISLLGACTTPGGPIYIIIEFADRGSLRSYLRGCRRGGRDALVAERLSLKSLISFAWQISRGMEYLSEMKIVHRDLAARNILLTSQGVCKVSDFGLSRDVYVDDTYLKQSRGKVPVKWMALESLSDQIYTSKSDVWSYGVLLWELLTLGIAPYPGIAIQNLFSLLQLGYRMENPVPNSNCNLYHLMQACWAARPSDRPSFKHITSILNQILQEGADYLDITADMVSNQEYMHFHATSPDND